MLNQNKITKDDLLIVSKQIGDCIIVQFKFNSNTLYGALYQDISKEGEIILGV